MNNDITKLPKWAQREIESARSTARYHEERLRQSLPGEGGAIESDTRVYMGYGRQAAGLPSGSSVIFTTENGDISAQVVGGQLHIHSSGGAIAVMPHVSNAVKISVMPR